MDAEMTMGEGGHQLLSLDQPLAGHVRLQDAAKNTLISQKVLEGLPLRFANRHGKGRADGELTSSEGEGQPKDQAR